MADGSVGYEYGDNIIYRFVDKNDDGNIYGSELNNRYLFGNGVDKILADEEVSARNPDGSFKEGNVIWALTDHIGSVRDLVSYDETTDKITHENHIKYNAFGEIIDESDPTIDHIFGFTARERDNESDLNYYRNRYYSPSTGRFLTADPIEDDFENSYRYVNNDPVNNVDPSGLVAGGIIDGKVATGMSIPYNDTRLYLGNEARTIGEYWKGVQLKPRAVFIVPDYGQRHDIGLRYWSRKKGKEMISVYRGYGGGSIEYDKLKSLIQTGMHAFYGDSRLSKKERFEYEKIRIRMRLRDWTRGKEVFKGVKYPNKQSQRDVVDQTTAGFKHLGNTAINKLDSISGGDKIRKYGNWLTGSNVKKYQFEYTPREKELLHPGQKFISHVGVELFTFVALRKVGNKAKAEDSHRAWKYLALGLNFMNVVDNGEAAVTNIMKEDRNVGDDLNLGVNVLAMMGGMNEMRDQFNHMFPNNPQVPFGPQQAPNPGRLVFDHATQTWKSPAGLVYGPDLRHGNRVKHVLAHLTPNPNKPNHSVFNVAPKQLIGLVDEAWTKKVGPGTLQGTIRRVWNVDMGRVIGTAGERHIRIVVENGNNIITAFPKLNP